MQFEIENEDNLKKFITSLPETFQQNDNFVEMINSIINGVDGYFKNGFTVFAYVNKNGNTISLRTKSIQKIELNVSPPCNYSTMEGHDFQINELGDLFHTYSYGNLYDANNYCKSYNFDNLNNFQISEGDAILDANYKYEKFNEDGICMINSDFYENIVLLNKVNYKDSDSFSQQLFRLHKPTNFDFMGGPILSQSSAGGQVHSSFRIKYPGLAQLNSYKVDSWGNNSNTNFMIARVSYEHPDLLAIWSPQDYVATWENGGWAVHNDYINIGRVNLEDAENYAERKFEESLPESEFAKNPRNKRKLEGLFKLTTTVSEKLGTKK